MPKRTDIKKILVIGSGPIIIGQAAEFDYAGTQACLALKEEGYEVILLNSNPATIMTDTKIADKVYMEPLTLEYVAKIIRAERPDAILPNMGGQTGLNLAVQLEKKGVLKECQTELIGMNSRSIERAEDRELFKDLCVKLGVPVIPSKISHSTEEAIEAANEIGYPVVLRPAFTLGGTGGGFASNEQELVAIMKNALSLSPAKQVLVEKSVKGYKEIEFEVMRDNNDTTICICSMENVDPVGIHTGDSIVVAPVQTLTETEYTMLKNSAFSIVKELGVQGGCNVQFALDPQSFNYFIIEVNPRVSRSSALASKASGYPIARVSTKIAVGLTLDEIKLESSVAATEPTLDYIVAKMPRFPFDKFVTASNNLSTQMKATGEVMSIGRTLEEAFLKAVRSLEIGTPHLYMKKFEGKTKEELLSYLKNCPADGIFAIAQLMRINTDLGIICNVTQMDMLFLEKVKNIIKMEQTLTRVGFGNEQALIEAKKMGFSDFAVAKFWDVPEKDVYALREKINLFPVYKMIDTCAGEFRSYVPFFYSTYENKNDSVPSENKKIIVLGAGPIRIGQGVEFDYSTVHAVDTIRKSGYEAIIINNNPETVSTDYTTSDKLYFEPLTVEDVMNIVRYEKPLGVIATLGGQTAINLAEPLMERGVTIIGTDFTAINNAEDRDAFEKIMDELKIPQPKGLAVTTIEAGLKAANEVGYPVMVRPSYVLGGQSMQIVSNDQALIKYLTTAVSINAKHPVLVDHYIQGKELEVDAICDGTDVFIPGVMQHIEKTGVHSGDSISVYPSFSVSDEVIDKIVDYTKKLGLRIGIKGIYNIQFIVDEQDRVFVIEVNPRSSRTVPFISKATGYMLADIATLVILGKSLKEQGITEILPQNKKGKWYVKAPVFSLNKIFGADAYLSPEMKSTGEAIGYDKSYTRALYKALQAAGTKVINYGSVFMTVSDKDKPEALELGRRFYNLGFNVEATKGTAQYFKEHGVRTKTRKKLSEGSDEILSSLRQGHISYVINTKDINAGNAMSSDGFQIRRCAVENNISIFTSLDTVRALLDVLEEITLCVSTIDA